MPHQELYIDGVWFPSVTTILNVKPKPWLNEWKKKWGALAIRKTKIADAIGTEFHRCVESWINTGVFIVKPPMADSREMPSTVARVKGMVNSWVNWAISVGGTIDATELQVISKRHTYSGTLDAVGSLAGKPMLFDWKTSKRIYNDMQLQLVAYANAYNEERPQSKPIKHGVIVHTSKEKPNYQTTEKQFNLGKRSMNQFLKLRAQFYKMQCDRDQLQGQEGFTEIL